MPVPEEVLTQASRTESVARALSPHPVSLCNPSLPRRGPPAPPSPATGFLEDSQSLLFGASFVAGYCSLEEQPLQRDTSQQCPSPPPPPPTSALGRHGGVSRSPGVPTHMSPTGVSSRRRCCVAIKFCSLEKPLLDRNTLLPPTLRRDPEAGTPGNTASAVCGS